MNAHTHSVPPGAGPRSPRPVARPVRRGKAYGVAVPRTPLLAHALPNIDWSDAYAVAVPNGAHDSSPAGVGRRPLPVAAILDPDAVRTARATGPHGRHRAWRSPRLRHRRLATPTRCCSASIRRHLAFRASVLVEDGRVVLSTLVDVRSRRGQLYSGLVRRIHPLVVRTLLARAARKMERPVTYLALGNGGRPAAIGSPRGRRVAGADDARGRRRCRRAGDVMRTLIRRYPLAAFVVLACLFGWSIWIGIFLAGGHGGGNLPLAPLMAVLVVAPCQGREPSVSGGCASAAGGPHPGGTCSRCSAPSSCTY